METKKISFGFMKTKKQEKPVATERKEYIECVEEKSIKVVGVEEIKDEAPLVIPMKPNTMITAERLRQIAEKVENFDDQPIKEENKDISDCKQENETLEEMAARELLEEAKKKTVVDVPTLVVPVPAQPVLEGQKESTLDDYESVPIQDFGMAMLRGMGWTPGQESKYKQPQLRPKGLGLGADKVIKENQQKKSSSKDNEEKLSIVKKSYVKITTGKYAGFYGQVVSLDEENGRAMVDIHIKKETVSLSEFMMQPVTKSEFDKESKVINADSYEEYKKNENTQKPSKKHSKTDNRDSSSFHKNSNDKKPKEYEDRVSNNGNRTDKRNNSPDSDRDRRRRHKSSRKYSSNESLNSSDSEYNKSKDRRRRNSTSSDSSSNYKHKKKSHSKSSKEKRDIDKKRKGKKKKRDRDRSPNYKKYRK